MSLGVATSRTRGTAVFAKPFWGNIGGKEGRYDMYGYVVRETDELGRKSG